MVDTTTDGGAGTSAPPMTPAEIQETIGRLAAALLTTQQQVAILTSTPREVPPAREEEPLPANPPPTARNVRRQLSFVEAEEARHRSLSRGASASSPRRSAGKAKTASLVSHAPRSRRGNSAERRSRKRSRSSSQTASVSPLARRTRRRNEGKEASDPWEFSPLIPRIQEVRLPKHYMTAKMGLEWYDGTTDPREHVHNVKGVLDLVLHSSDAMCKVLPSTFKGVVRRWYNSLEPESILSFADLCTKLVSRFSTSIPAEKRSTDLFSLVQGESESTRAYLSRFNEEMLKVEGLLEPVAVEALVRGIYDEDLWQKVFPMSDKTLLRVKRVMEGHIRVEEARESRHSHRGFGKAPEGKNVPSGSPSQKQGSSRRARGSVHSRLTFPEEAQTPLNASVMEVFTAVKNEDYVQYPPR